MISEKGQPIYVTPNAKKIKTYVLFWALKDDSKIGELKRQNEGDVKKFVEVRELLRKAFEKEQLDFLGSSCKSLAVSTLSSQTSSSSSCLSSTSPSSPSSSSPSSSSSSPSSSSSSSSPSSSPLSGSSDGKEKYDESERRVLLKELEQHLQHSINLIIYKEVLAVNVLVRKKKKTSDGDSGSMDETLLLAFAILKYLTDEKFIKNIQEKIQKFICDEVTSLGKEKERLEGNYLDDLLHILKQTELPS